LKVEYYGPVRAEPPRVCRPQRNMRRPSSVTNPEPTNCSSRALAHSQITEVYYIISGNGTLVTGGTLENAKDRPTTGRTVIGPSTEGTKILNGKSRQVGPGDMVIIPPDTPHTFTEITTDRIVYMVVRVDPHKILQAD
jgi:mannose-6-phosphate isomerase-like protein (cupin superfamily)